MTARSESTEVQETCCQRPQWTLAAASLRHTTEPTTRSSPPRLVEPNTGQPRAQSEQPVLPLPHSKGNRFEQQT